jgi:hypothetical protein
MTNIILSHMKKHEYRTSISAFHVFIASVFLGLLFSKSAIASDWIFDSQVIRSSDNPRESIAITDPFDIEFVRKIFPTKTISFNDDESDVIIVSDGASSFAIGGWDNKIFFIRGWDGDFEDVLGNGIGDPLMRAIGGSVAICDNGESPTCRSTVGKTLNYLVDLCDPSSFPSGIGRYEIKQCDKIDGFLLTNE